MANCPLDDPELGIISENDHKVGNCLCAFCTCDQHVCPFQKTQLYVPIKSKYNSEFHAKPVESPKKVVRESYVPNAQKMDFRTTNSELFQVFQAKPVKRKVINPAVRPLKFVGNSAYRTQYVNWGPSETNLIKQQATPLRGNEIPFKGTSSYKQSFLALQTDQSRPQGDRKGLNFSFGKEMMETKSTYSRTMNFTNRDLMHRQQKSNTDTFTPRNSSPSHFVTTAHLSFQRFSPSVKDPQLMKRYLNRP